MAKHQLDEGVGDASVTALDALEVQALFAALRDAPRAADQLRRAFERMKNRLTPAGRSAFELELERLEDLQPTEPGHLLDLGEGDFALEVCGEEGLAGRWRLSCRAGKRALVVPLGSRGECRISLDELGRVRDGLVAEGVRLQLRGAVAVKAGYLRLELFAEGALGSRRVRSLLTGVGDARCGHA